MIDVSQALTRVLDRAAPLPTTSVPLECAPGRVLAEGIASDIDSPPYDKSLLDGYAVIAADLAGGRLELEVVEEITAGDVPIRSLRSGQAARIMTGAPLPSGADTVVPVEYTDLQRSESTAVVQIRANSPRAGRNILRRGAVMRCGESTFQAGRVLTATDVGVLAEVGRNEVTIHRRPTVAVLSTGNELVPHDHVPSPGRIRNTNGPMLSALAAESGAEVTDMGIAPDDRQRLAQSVVRGLDADVLLLSGGVSVGVHDLVPGVLTGSGVESVFHKVRLRPGKPLWFGIGGRRDRRTLVFGLPGNPASSLVCFCLFARPALEALAGRRDTGLPVARATLAQPHQVRGDRPTYFPSQLRFGPRGYVVEPLTWRGSADLLTLAHADCLALFDTDKQCYEAGETVTVYLLRARFGSS
jgi:molybdopterin molybdotransferase